MTQGERVKEIRKNLTLTLEKFGEKLGVGKTAISKIERNENTLTDQMAKAICHEYNVNYDWLICGEGEMFSVLPQTVLDELCKQYNCDELDRTIITEYLKLNETERQAVKKYICNIIGK